MFYVLRATRRREVYTALSVLRWHRSAQSVYRNRQKPTVFLHASRPHTRSDALAKNIAHLTSSLFLEQAPGGHRSLDPHQPIGPHPVGRGGEGPSRGGRRGTAVAVDDRLEAEIHGGDFARDVGLQFRVERSKEGPEGSTEGGSGAHGDRRRANTL